MHFFSPDRPKVSHMPAFCPHGEIRGPLPALMIYPRGEVLEISAFLCKTISTASRVECTIPLSELSEFYLAWLGDPEKVAIERFNYKIAYDEPKLKKPAITFSLDDLDL